jgi:hypothetical protein
MPSETIIYRGAELYEQVRTEPVRTVAKRYGVSDVAFAKICRKLAVPLPGRGYWARKAAGQTPRRPPLAKAPEGVEEEMKVTHWRDDRHPPPPLPAEVQERVVREREPQAAIVVAATLEQPHKLVTSASRLLGRAKANEDGLVTSREKRCLDVSVSPALLDRALRILDALVKACEQRKLRVEVTDVVRFDERGYRRTNADVPPNTTRVLVDEEWISFRLVEKWSVDRPPMPKPPKGFVGPKLDTWMWMNKPRARRIPNGVLELSLVSGYTRAVWKDGKRQRVEECLNDIVSRLYILANGIKQARAEAEHRAYEEQQRAKQFQERLDKWRLARDIREYAAEAQAIAADGHCSITAGSSLDNTLRWALSYADRVDPLSALRADIARLAAERTKPAAGPDDEGQPGQ